MPICRKMSLVTDLIPDTNVSTRDVEATATGNGRRGL